MSHSQQLAVVRQIVAEFYSRHQHGSAPPLHEAIMIRCGLYCGRRFDAADGYAVWIADDDEVVFFDLGGNVQRVAAVTSAEQPSRRLAA